MTGATPLLVTVGECLALLVGTGAGGLEYGTQAEISFGGSEGNVAICAARLGAEVAWVGRVGDDVFGHRILRTLRGEGIEVHGTIDPDHATAMMLKERIGVGRTRVTYLREGMAGSRTAVSDVPAELVERASVLHVTGISLGLGATIRETIFATVRAAKEAGVLVSFDVNHRNKLWSPETAAPVYREVVSLADIVFAGDEEAALIVDGASPAELATALAALGPEHAIVKLGERGATAFAAGQLVHRDAVAVDVIDTVGAGDAFVSGYLTELMQGESLETRLATAVACGAFACLRAGDWESMPTRTQIDSLLAEGDPVDR